MTTKWGFGVAMLPEGALCFYQAHFGHTVLPKWSFWAHLFYSMLYSISELRRACFRQARVARAVLPPGALFRAGAFAIPACAPKSHLCPLPHLGFFRHVRSAAKDMGCGCERFAVRQGVCVCVCVTVLLRARGT